MHDGNLERGKRDVSVQRLDRGIVPLGDLAHEDPGKRRPVEHELAGLEALKIEDGNDAAHDHRKLNDAVGVELLLVERLVRGPERSPSWRRSA